MEWQIREEESKLKVLSGCESSGVSKKEAAVRQVGSQKRNEKHRKSRAQQ